MLSGFEIIRPASDDVVTHFGASFSFHSLNGGRRGDCVVAAWAGVTRITVRREIVICASKIGGLLVGFAVGTALSGGPPAINAIA